MRGANMSVVGSAVVKCYATGCTSERVLGNAFVVRFQVAIKDRLVSKPFVAAGAFVRFLPNMDALMGR